MLESTDKPGRELSIVRRWRALDAVEKHGHLLNPLVAGDCFGEMAVIGRGDGTRNADVIAATDARIVTIPGQALRNASAACRMHFYAGFLDVLKTRLALANARLASV